MEFLQNSGTQFSFNMATDYFDFGLINKVAKVSNTLLTANRNFEFPNASGTIALTSDLPTSADYIQNGTTQQTANLNISGNGFFGGNVGIGTTTPQTKLNVFDGVNGAALRLSATASAYWEIRRNSATGNLDFNDDGIGTTLSLNQITGAATFASSVTAGEIYSKSAGGSAPVVISNLSAPYYGSVVAMGADVGTSQGGIRLVSRYDVDNKPAFTIETSTNTQSYGANPNSLTYSEAFRIASTGAATFASSVTSGGNLKIIRPLDIGTTFMQIEVDDVNTTFNGQDPDGWMSYNFNSNGTNRLSINGQTGAATFASSVTASNLNISDSSSYSFGSGTTKIIGNSTANVLDIQTNNVSALFINATGAATFASSVTATSLNSNSTSSIFGDFNTTNANGGYITFKKSGVINYYLGSAAHLIGGGVSSDLAIVSNGGIVFGAGGTSEKARISATGAATFASSVTAGGDFRVLAGSSINLNRPDNGAASTILMNSSNQLVFTAPAGATFSSSVTATNGYFTSDGKFGTRIKINNVNQWFGDGTMFSSSDGVNGLGIRNDLGRLLFSAGSAVPNLIIETSGAATFSSSVTAGSFIASNGTVRLKSYTVSTLPAGVQGDTAYVTDALGFTYNSILTGGGSGVTIAFFDGTNWRAH